MTRGQGPRLAGAARPSPRRRSSPRRGSSLGPDSLPVVGLGASAGGLGAFRRLLTALPASTGMAFILIQHLDPTHASMMVDLLAGHIPSMSISFPRVLISRSRVAPSASRNRGSVTARACRSTSSCARWRRSSAAARSA